MKILLTACEVQCIRTYRVEAYLYTTALLIVWPYYILSILQLIFVKRTLQLWWSAWYNILNQYFDVINRDCLQVNFLAINHLSQANRLLVFRQENHFLSNLTGYIIKTPTYLHTAQTCTHFHTQTHLHVQSQFLYVVS